MNEQKILKAIASVQSNLHQLISIEIKGVRREMGGIKNEIKSIKTGLKGVEKRLTLRIDKIGKHLAFLEDDTPTREEFDQLDTRVAKLEKN